MKQYTLKTVNENDEVIAESTLTLKEGSMLIVKVPDSYSYEKASNIHSFISSVLQSERNMITIHDSVKLQVLEIQ